jgi:hypothetical protein
MKLLCRSIGRDEVEQETTQRDQFNTDEVGLTETLIRESHQNSLDAALGQGPVRTKIRILVPEAGSATYWKSLLSPLEPHLKACGLDVDGLDLGRPRLLILEDFNTSGLTGAWNKKDEGNFSDFWRRVGRSHKKGAQGGRWGLGKLVFSSSSRIRTFFGLTVRNGDSELQPLLMGQAVLATHRVADKDFAPHAFFADDQGDGFQVPVTGSVEIDAFRRAAGVTRKNETGLSIVIPCIPNELKLESFIPYVVRNYFFPILTGQLEIEIGSERITGETFGELARKFGGPSLADGHLIRFIRDIETAGRKEPAITLGAAWTESIEKAIGEERLKALREQFSGRTLVHVRAPITLRRKSGVEDRTSFDLFLRRADDGVTAQSLFVRGAITLPGESQYFRSTQSFGALVAMAPTITAFLGDAENPAHTKWNGNAEKLSANWRNPATRLREIRNSLDGLYGTLVRAIERLEQDALKHLLSVKADGLQKVKPDPIVKPPVVPPLPQKPRPYDIASRQGGFAIKGRAGAAGSFPLQIRVKAAYDLARGNPFSKHSPYDFDFTKNELAIGAANATCRPVAANELLIEAPDESFSVEVTGFDVNRDLLVRTIV